MKTIIRVICTTVLASSLLLMPKAALAGCSSCDGFMDNGHAINLTSTINFVALDQIRTAFLEAAMAELTNQLLSK